jgi:hypothetical protein
MTTENASTLTGEFPTKAEFPKSAELRTIRELATNWLQDARCLATLSLDHPKPVRSLDLHHSGDVVALEVFIAWQPRSDIAGLLLFVSLATNRGFTESADLTQRLTRRQYGRSVSDG